MSRPLLPVHRDGLTMAKLCATPGLCLFCEEPLPAPRKHRVWRHRSNVPATVCIGRPRLICGSPDCKAAYFRAWRRDWRMARSAA